MTFGYNGNMACVVWTTTPRYDVAAAGDLGALINMHIHGLVPSCKERSCAYTISMNGKFGGQQASLFDVSRSVRI